MIAIAFAALRHARVQFLHRIVLEIAIRADVKGRVDEFLVVIGQLRALEPAADIDAVVRVEILRRITLVTHRLGYRIEPGPQPRNHQQFVAIFDDIVGSQRDRVIKRLLPPRRSRLKIGNFLRQRDAICHFLAHHHHLGQRSDGDRRHRIVPAAPFRIGKRRLLRLADSLVLGHGSHRRAADHVAIGLRFHA